MGGDQNEFRVRTINLRNLVDNLTFSKIYIGENNLDIFVLAQNGTILTVDSYIEEPTEALNIKKPDDFDPMYSIDGHVKMAIFSENNSIILK